MARAKGNSFFLLIFLWLASLTAYAQNAHEPVVSIKRVDSNIEVSASITLPVKPCEAYALLTDYDKLPSFISGLLESRYERISNTTVRVRQVGEVEVMFVHVPMESLLEMEEVPNQRILFKQIEGDLASYGGAWNLSETPDGTRVSYNASLSFKQFVPMFLARSVLEDEVDKGFAAIAKEALARKDKGSFNCAAKK